ncbi:MAG: fused MFS/spermidine synthase [Bacteroidota bacterium]
MYSAGLSCWAALISGAVLMIVEIVGGLVLAPFFGSTIFVWASIISIFMLGLSLGYLLGGEAASRDWGLKAVAAMMALSAAYLFLDVLGIKIPAYLIALFHPSSSVMRFMPLVVAAFFYLIPSTAIGMITPLAIGASATGSEFAGTEAGRIASWSTVGGLSGALMSTFIFPVFAGNKAVLTGCGIILMLTAAALFIMSVRKGRTPAKPQAQVQKLPLHLIMLAVICGAAVLVLEIAGGAWVALYFGGSVYVWGGTISVFLIVMALGYFGGGIIADRGPSITKLGCLIVFAGVSVLIIPFIAPAVCLTFQGIRSTGSIGVALSTPFLAATILYGMPTLLLSMVSSFSVRLAAEKIPGTGRAAGRIYTFSTLGSVAGALGTALLLFGGVGKSNLFEGTGSVLVVAGLITIVLYNRPFLTVRWLATTVVAIVLIVLLVGLSKPQPISLVGNDEIIAGSYGEWSIVQLKENPDCVMLRRLRTGVESPYHHMAVIDEKALPVGKEIRADDGQCFPVSFTSPDGNNRMLLFDCYVQSAVQLDSSAGGFRMPYTSGLLYTDLLHLPFLFRKDIRDVLVIGGGGGVGSLILKQSYPIRLDVVEIDPAVVSLAQQWFGFLPDERMQVHVADGRMYIRETSKLYDLIILDAYSAGGRIPFHLTTKEFMEEVKSRLLPGGTVLMNVISGVEGRKGKLFRSVLKTMTAVFGRGQVMVFPRVYTPEWDRTKPRNLLLFASSVPIPNVLQTEALRKRLEEIQRENGISLSMLESVIPLQLTPEDLIKFQTSEDPLLTDDYSPVDLLSAGIESGSK